MPISQSTPDQKAFSYIFKRFDSPSRLQSQAQGLGRQLGLGARGCRVSEGRRSALLLDFVPDLGQAEIEGQNHLESVGHRWNHRHREGDGEER